MADVSRREEWGRDFDAMAEEGAFTAQLAASRRPNDDVEHDMEESLARGRRFMPTVVASLLRATMRLASPGK
jgi:hypothetical protein